ncbi:MAG: uracil-DNA glycosylase [Allosphingosinicella sp.]|uniref:uracil-DNA glycosylase n=1 Tax=Allosphingosinicella sp. TaxID=2823234 RepID=UPI0039296AEF
MSPAAAASALQWWADAGVDILVDEEPRDWLNPKAKAPPPPPEPQPAPEDALPDQLDLFQAWLAGSDRLAFASPSAPRVCPSGDPSAGLMILTDMPTLEDCGAGTLLSGDVGRLFDRMLAAIGRDRASIYLAALSCLRSPDGQLGGEAAQACATLARHHVGLAAPKSLLLLGDACAKALLGLPVARARGRWHRIATHAGEIDALVTIAPRQLLENPTQKRHAWADLQMLMEGPGR